jgi:hypothetical protein
MEPKDLEALKESNPKAYEHINKLNEDLKKASKKDEEPPKDDEPQDDDPEEDLLKKSKKDKKSDDSKRNESRRIESALTFNMGLESFMKENDGLLPSEFARIVETSKKENYDTALDRASALKSAMVQEFFSVQSNVDLLTSAQKNSLEDFLKLTKNGKEEKAEFVFGHLFEPALQTLRNVKKAEELGKARAGYGDATKAEDAYKARLIQISRKKHLGEKGEN